MNWPNPAGGVLKTVLASAVLGVLAMPGVQAATISSTNPESYGYVMKSGESSVTGEKIEVSGAEVNLYVSDKKTVVQHHGILARTADSNRAVVTVGDQDTQTISINVRDEPGAEYEVTNGITVTNDNSSLAGGKVVVTAKDLNIDVHGNGDVYAVYAQNRTTSVEDEDQLATIIINAENTVINATSETAGGARGIVAMSQGIIKINGNLEVHADDAITARGDAQVYINQNSDKTVKLYGDIDFDYNGSSSGTKVDANVVINLTNADSVWEGNTKVTWEGETTDEKKTVNGMQLNLSNGATWNPTIVSETGDSSEGTMSIGINTLALNDGVINITQSDTQAIKVDTLKGTGGKVNVAASTTDGSTFQTAKLVVGSVENEEGSATPTINVGYTGITADDVKNASAAMASLAKAVAVTSEESSGVTQNLTVSEGKVAGELTATQDSNGNLSSVKEKSNTVMASLKNIGSNNALVFKSQMNDLDKRMGDLRTMPQSDGAWARVIAGQSEYKNSHNTYQTLQVGADKRFGNFFAGVMGSYTDGDGTLSNGSTDDKNYSFGIYGGWLGDDGQFVDVTIKRHKYESDYDIYYTSGEKIDGSMDTSGTSVSLEYGRRFGITDTNYYVEPQVEFMYGHLNSTGYTTSNGVRMSQDAVKTAVGRLGVAAGWVDPAKRGSAYIKASVLNDWAGNIRTSATAGDVSRRYHEDTGGTWGEFAVGGTWNITKNVSAYGEMETTAGNPVRTTYQVSGGVRVSF